MSDRLFAPSPGLLAGRYRLGNELGRGGMAVVHVAVDEVLDREVAVKLLHAHLAGDEEVLERFRREARAAAQVDHPSVVRVHDWGVEEDGRPYLVMERVRGSSLREVLRTRGRLTPGEALALLGPALTGLRAVHERGFVHRDVTPGNLLVDEHGHTRLSDFGLARSVAASTNTGLAVVGSPHYLSPEAVRGEMLDQRADVYAVGCVLLECLTGEPPFTADTPVAVAARHTTERVPDPSTRVPELPRALDRVVRRATEPDAADRFPDAAALGAALAAAVPGGPTSIDLRDGTSSTVVPAEHATRQLAQLGVTDVVGPAPQPRRGRRVVLLSLALLVVGTLGWFGFDRLLAPVADVPSVVGQGEPAARDAVEEAGFAVAEEVVERTDPDAPAGTVLAQSAEGASRRLLTTVALTVSVGPATAPLPDVAGLAPDDVVAVLEGLGIDLEVQQDTAFSDGVPAGDLVEVRGEDGTPLGEGSQVVEGSTVTVVASEGREPVEVPEVVGQDETAATDQLGELGLQVSVAERRNEDGTVEGEVLAVTPPSGTGLRRGDEVALEVSDGPAPVVVPDVRGRDQDEAEAALAERGLTAAIVPISTINPFRVGEVDAQDPSAGAEARRGDEVLLFVWE